MFAFDSDGMVLAEMEPGETQPGLPCRGMRVAFPLAMPRRVGAILLSVTHRCNLRCTYCFSSVDSLRSRGSTDMQFESVERFASLFLAERPQQRERSPVSCSFFGGEPLLRWRFMRSVVEFLERWVGGVSFHVTTNGTMLTEKVCRFLKAHKFGAIVSIDGPPSAHDEARHTRSGKGSSDLVMRGLKTLRSVAPEISSRVTLRATFTASSLSTCSIADRLDYLNDLCDDGLGGHVSVEPAFLGEMMCMDRELARATTPDLDDQDSANLWDQHYADAATWWLARLRSGRIPRFHHFNYMLRRLILGQPSPTECGAGKGYACLSPDGTIYACHREAGTKIGHLSYGIDHELAAPWQDNRYYARLRCPTCPIRNVCGGGCRELSQSQGLGLFLPLKAECKVKMLQFVNSCWILSELKDDAERTRAAEVVGAKQCKHG